MDKYQSQLLVAVPQLPDDNFYRAVVLLIHHDQEGAFGVILNRPTNFPLRE
ncbi:MAG: YqgE/AlgH family protein, partial [Planctomycetota bacterium]|nr:YqgE/AlgH family protein [Planctomycetota bacterium]